MGLRFDPMGGGQFKQAVKAIIDAESQPIKQLEVRKAREEARMKLFQEFKSKFTGVDKVITDLASFKNFRELKVDLGDGQNLAAITLDKNKAEPGSYQVEINQTAARTSIISNRFDSPDENILGIGYVVMNLPNGDSSEIFVDESNASLRGVAQLINEQVNSPVRAAVIQDSSDPDRRWRLIVSAKKEGAADQIEFPDFYFLDGDQDLWVDDDREAQNAHLKIDGFEIELPSNQVTDFLPGVNMQVKQARPDQPFTLTISEDYQKISQKVKGMVDQLNGILEFIYKQNQIDEKSDTRNSFAGDTGLQTIEYRIRNLLHEGFPVWDKEDQEDYRFKWLNEVGINFGKDGKLSFSEEKFTKSMQDDFQGVAQAITGEYGFAAQVKETMRSYTQIGNGVLVVREQGLRNRITEIDRQIDYKQKIVDRKAQAVTDQFARLQGTMNRLQQQQNYLSASLGGGGGGNLVAQLLGG